ncbi:DEAD/DEAH box helicase family protein [Aeromicrobium sp. REDSEA-S32_B7]|uniref:DEAD/DEAH box helicase family protein n=1 Tax=Aeromicrobium sp. REDSEA-S32_B7 TaxID=1811526 RepID=UPI0029550817|nr:DEAD/DEAH box helicase family protein [Aeromicrobium sp. REDSEA-S32_B7]
MTGPFALRRFQAEALDALERARAAGRRRSWVSLPPGAGKTVLGTELVAARLAAEGRRAVVLTTRTTTRRRRQVGRVRSWTGCTRTDARSWPHCARQVR